MPEKKTILYLDDEEMWQRNVVGLLDEYDVRVASDEREFIKILEDERVKPQLFVIDWLLTPSGEKTAQGLVKYLLTEYSRIPRIVLTSGSDEGLVSTITELECRYVDKDSVGDLPEVVRTYIGEGEGPEPVPPVAEPDSIAKGNIGTLEKSRNKIKREKLSTEQSLQSKEHFFQRFMNVTKGIVDEEQSLPEFANNLLHLLVEYNDCYSGVYLSFRDNDGQLVHRDFYPPGGGGDQELRKFTERRISIGEVAVLSELRKLAQRAIEESPGNSPRHAASRVLSDFRNDPTFARTRLAELGDRKHLLLVPVHLEGKAVGAVLLFDRRDGRCFDDEDKRKIDLLPLSDMLNGAAEMPFRAYDQKGAMKGSLKRLTKLIAMVTRGRYNPKPWKWKEKLISTYMELLWLGVVLASVAILVVPVYMALKAPEHSRHIQILGSIELLLMFLTFILFSLGLIVLFEPTYARALPKWMLSFTRISTLEGTILRLVVIILAIHILGRFLDSVIMPDNSTVRYTAMELFVVSLSVCIMTLAVGVFTKYFLHDNEKKDEEDA